MAVRALLPRRRWGLLAAGALAAIVIGGLAGIAVAKASTSPSSIGTVRPAPTAQAVVPTTGNALSSSAVPVVPLIPTAPAVPTVAPTADPKPAAAEPTPATDLPSPPTDGSDVPSTAPRASAPETAIVAPVQAVTAPIAPPPAPVPATNNDDGDDGQRTPAAPQRTAQPPQREVLKTDPPAAPKPPDKPENEKPKDQQSGPTKPNGNGNGNGNGNAKKGR